MAITIIIAIGIGTIALIVLGIIALIYDTWSKVDDIHEKLLGEESEG